MIVLDLSAESDRYYETKHSFFGQTFIWGLLQNFGGINDMSGSLQTINQVINNFTTGNPI